MNDYQFWRNKDNGVIFDKRNLFVVKSWNTSIFYPLFKNQFILSFRKEYRDL